MRILNLYAGLGGNRRSWTDHEVVAVEIIPEIAAIYSKQYPEDEIFIQDVLEFVREHDLEQYDFIWASPPCVTHSCATSFHSRYVPDLQSIHGLRIFFDYQIKGNTKYCIENVQPFYTLKKYFSLLALPNARIDRHLFWANFHIPKPQKPIADERIHHDMTKHKRTRSLYMRGSIKLLATFHDFNLELLNEFKKGRKDKALKNMTHWKVGKYILDCIMNKTTLLSYIKEV